MSTVTGLNKEQTDKVIPGYFHEIELYESGISNAYTINHPGGSPASFEKKISFFLQKLETSDYRNVDNHWTQVGIDSNFYKLCAKKKCYPNDFYGYISFDNASFSVVEIDKNDINIIGVNKSVEEFDLLQKKCDYNNQ